VGILLLVLPVLTTPVLPFHDAPGIVGLGGALALRDDPAARVRDFYQIDIRPYPSALYFGWALLAGALGIPIDWAYSLFLAIFCLAGPPLALLLLLDAFRRPRYLALLALPVGFHHQIWYGFLGSSAAVTGMVAALALARRLVDRPTLGNHLGLAGAVLLVAAAHPFPLAITLLMLAPLLLWPPPSGAERRWRQLGLLALRLATLLPTAVFLARWVGSFFAGRAGGVSLWRRLSVELPLRPPTLADAPLFLDWLGNGYAGAWDEVVPGLALLTLVALLVAGARPAAPDPDPDADAVPAAAMGGRHGRDWLALVGLGWPALVLACGYLFLPMRVMWPEPWWGLRVRLVVPLFLVAIAGVRPRARGMPPWALAPAAAAAAAFAVYVSYDFATHWRGRSLAGFAETLAAIPPGRSVLFFPASGPGSPVPDRHYTLAHPYLGQHYVARKGGRVLPHLRGHPGAYWITMKPPEPPAPSWGDPRQFDWPAHAAGFDYFLLEVPAEGLLPDPMRTAPPGAYGTVLARGRFILWTRLGQ
jgi:hypothetical protein